MLTVITHPTTPPPRRKRPQGWRVVRRQARCAAGAVGQTGGSTPHHRWGYAIRRDWPDGTHDLFAFTPDKDTAERNLTRDHTYWHSGPIRPAAVSIVAAHTTDVDHHPVDGCRNPSCPHTPQRGEQ